MEQAKVGVCPRCGGLEVKPEYESEVERNLPLIRRAILEYCLRNEGNTIILSTHRLTTHLARQGREISPFVVSRCLKKVAEEMQLERIEKKPDLYYILRRNVGSLHHTIRMPRIKVGYGTCRKHGEEGKIQVKLYVEHWLPDKKRPSLCYLSLKDLPPHAQKRLQSYGLRVLESEGGKVH